MKIIAKYSRICIFIFILISVNCVAQNSVLIYTIDTNYKNPEEPDIVRHQIFVQNGNVIKPLLQVEQYEDDFYYIGSLGIKDSTIFIFNNYNSPVGTSRYYLIAPIINKLYYVEFLEGEFFLNSINFKNNLVNYIGFKNECGEFKTKEMTIREIEKFIINKDMLLLKFKIIIN